MDSLTLVHMLWAICWQGGLLAGIVWVLTRLFPRAPARWRHALWLLVLVKFCIPPVLTLPVPSLHQQAPVLMPIHSVQARMPVGTDTTISHGSTSLAVDDQRRSRDGDQQVAVPPQERPPIFDRLQLPASFSDYAPDLLVLAWVCGMLVMGGGLLVRGRRQVYILRHADEATEEQHALLDEATSSLGLRHHPRLLLSPLASTPMLVGVWRPAILLPPEILQQCRPSELRAMLAHELAHVKREDLLWFWLQQWVQVIFFFHPALWLAARALHQARELACDELVLAHTSIPAKEYAAGYVSALKLAQQRPSFAPGVAMAEPFEVEQRRIEQMLRHRTTPSTLRWLPALLLLAAVGLPTFLGCGAKHKYIGAGPAASLWPSENGTAQDTRFAPVAPIVGKVKWATPTGQDRIAGAPVIGEDGTVYAISYLGGQLMAFDGATGHIKWQSPTAHMIPTRNWWLSLQQRHKTLCVWDSSPAVGANGLVYVFSADHFLYAFDAKTGKQVWRAATKDYSNYNGSNTSPIIGPDGTVYAGGSSCLVAVDGATGHVKWSRGGNEAKFGYQIQGIFSGSPIVGPDGTVYLIAEEFKQRTPGVYVCALSPHDGSVKWQMQPTTKRDTCPRKLTLTPDGRLLVTCMGSWPKEVALDSATGKVKWDCDLGQDYTPYGTSYRPPAIGADGTLYIASYNGTLCAVDGSSGKMRWTTAFPVNNTSSSSRVIVVTCSPFVINNDRLYVTGMMKSLHDPRRLEQTLCMFDGKTGRLLKTYQFINRAYSNTSIGVAVGKDGTLYFGGQDGKFYAVQ